MGLRRCSDRAGLSACLPVCLPVCLSVYLLILIVCSAAFMFCFDVKPFGYFFCCCYRPKIALLFTFPTPPPFPPSLLPLVIAIKSLVFLLRPLHGFIHKVLFSSPATLPPSFVHICASVPSRPAGSRTQPPERRPARRRKDECFPNRHPHVFLL